MILMWGFPWNRFISACPYRPRVARLPEEEVPWRHSWRCQPYSASLWNGMWIRRCKLKRKHVTNDNLKQCNPTYSLAFRWLRIFPRDFLDCRETGYRKFQLVLFNKRWCHWWFWMEVSRLTDCCCAMREIQRSFKWYRLDVKAMLHDWLPH